MPEDFLQLIIIQDRRHIYIFVDIWFSIVTIPMAMNKIRSNNNNNNNRSHDSISMADSDSLICQLRICWDTTLTLNIRTKHIDLIEYIFVHVGLSKWTRINFTRIAMSSIGVCSCISPSYNKISPSPSMATAHILQSSWNQCEITLTCNNSNERKKHIVGPTETTHTHTHNKIKMEKINWDWKWI